MPMHDWTRVDPNDYHDFHLSWMMALKTVLNAGLLPPGYFAMAEHTTPPIVPDVVTLSVPMGSAEEAVLTNGSDQAVATIPPRAEIVSTEHAKKQKAVGRRRLAIRHVRNRQLVAVIEIVSPSNKAKKPEFTDLVEKSAQLLRQGVHLLLIDPFPPTARDRNGLHAAVWKELTGKKFIPPIDKPLTLAAYAALGDDTFSAYVNPLAVGDLLPDLPLFLTPERYVYAPLEDTYQTAWASFPLPLHPLLESPPATG